MRITPLAVIAVLTAACGTSEPRMANGKAASGDVACSADQGDSARAVCIATQPEFPGSAHRTVSEVVRHGDTICVVTSPGEQTGTDGTARVKVVRDAVVERVVSDSIGCR